MRKCFQIRVYGKVQGVFFRASTKQKADELGVKGFVKNEPDGSVYVEAEAEEQVLTTFLNWCKRGPSNARVERCDVTEVQVQNFPVFEIRR